MRYLEPRLEVEGKHPVWSVENLPVISICFRKKVCIIVLDSDGMASTGVAAIFVVELREPEFNYAPW